MFRGLGIAQWIPLKENETQKQAPDRLVSVVCVEQVRQFTLIPTNEEQHEDADSTTVWIPPTDTQGQKVTIKRRIRDVCSQLPKLAEESHDRNVPLRERINKLELSLAELKKNYSELACLIKTHATNHAVEFVWQVSVSEVALKTKDAQTRETAAFFVCSASKILYNGIWIQCMPSVLSQWWWLW